MPTNPLNFDPSRTGMNRRAFVAEMTRRFEALQRAIRGYLVTQNALGLTTNAWTDAAREASSAARHKWVISEKSETLPGFLGGYKVVHIEAHHPETGKRAGVAQFKPQLSGELHPESIHVEMTFRRQGVATAIYEHVLRSGRRIKKQPGLSKEGAKFRKAFDARHLITNAPFHFETNDDKLKKFNEWLKKQADEGILKASPKFEPIKAPGEPQRKFNIDKPWIYTHIESAYTKGIKRGFNETHQIPLGAEKGYGVGAKDSFFRSATGRPIRVEKIRMLYTRAYENLKGVTADMGAKMSNVLAEGLVKGWTPNAIARRMAKVTGMSLKRAKTIARTEIVHAHAEGQLDAMEDAGVKRVGARVEWTTQKDDRVCPKCEDMEGKIFTIVKARGRIPLHPNCRCAWTPVPVRQKKKKKP